ncbi:MAG TPA: EcsC family protein, partial [Phnomibacter sp.]|nr:EcsC family protein [Phnomibacter sp.]
IPGRLTHYELQMLRKLNRWQKEMQLPQSRLSRISKRFQDRFNRMIPDKVHNTITAVIRKIVEAVLFTSEFIKPALDSGASLEEREKRVKTRMEYYRTTAAAEGGITGWGGFWSAMADFPALLTIKLKFLFDVAAIYGYNTANMNERIFLLKVFQLAFSSPLKKKETYLQMAAWAEDARSIPSDPEALDWYRFQQDYRDYLDVAKLLQMIPGIGAAVGLVVNYNLMNRLADTAIMCYRLRWMHEKSGTRDG